MYDLLNLVDDILNKEKRYRDLSKLLSSNSFTRLCIKYKVSAGNVTDEYDLVLESNLKTKRKPRYYKNMRIKWI